MILYDERNVDACTWPETPLGRLARDYFVPLMKQGSTAYLSDRTTLRLVEMDDLRIPLAVNDAEYDNSALHSTYARYISLQLTGVTAQAYGAVRAGVMRGGMKTLGAMLKAGRIDKCVYVDHWLVLRNLSTQFDDAQVARLTDFLVEQFPGHAIVFLALNPASYSPLLNTLAGRGYDFVYGAHTRVLLPTQADVTRQVRENRRRDGRLLEAAGYRIVDGREVPGCERRLMELYRALNGGKYHTNLQYTEAFFEWTLRERILEYRLAVKDGRVDGFYAHHVHDDVLWSPLFGYDLSLPQEVGLYRGLVYQLMQDALDVGQTIELGPGADPFKSLRGSVPVPRWSAVYTKHLAGPRKLAWRMLQRYANDAVRPASGAMLRRIDGDGIVGFGPLQLPFTPPTGQTPLEAARTLREQVDALEAALEAASRLEGEARLRELAPLSQTLHNWPQPMPRVVALRERLTRLEQEARRKPAQATSAAAVPPVEHARQLLQDATRWGDTALVAAHLGDAPAPHLKALVEALRQAAGSVGVVLTATRGDKVVLVTAASEALRGLGLDAGQLMAKAAPCVDGKGGGSPEVAWGGGSRADGIDAALTAARQYVQSHLSGTVLEGAASGVPGRSPDERQ
ncbi:DHHA1 domain-containing protein [Corallococcus llansteffanensis]|uniref:Alanine--tRNA ligase n=1 Tax=Corallococcus llansteffanensis TaxID=2316731 RepID=A0A3A8PJM2_9BACT|nr:DHHA1 domain-containing protein [Corallococcus llansteffanensis]RKH56576.1 GNAT family N-acetyltransferase [Corallococcus llansteffanensis]